MLPYRKTGNPPTDEKTIAVVPFSPQTNLHITLLRWANDERNNDWQVGVRKWTRSKNPAEPNKWFPVKEAFIILERNLPELIEALQDARGALVLLKKYPEVVEAMPTTKDDNVANPMPAPPDGETTRTIHCGTDPRTK